MKNYIYKLLFLGLFISIVSCSGDESFETVSSEFIVEGYIPDDKNNEEHIFTINIDVYDKSKNEKWPTIVHNFISDDREKNISNLPEKFDNFNGIFEIKVGDKVISQTMIKKGKVISFNKISELKISDYDCSVEGIIECADDTINDMNWIEYGFCAATAPMCLARVYSSCTFENCGGDSSGPGDIEID